VCSYGGVSDGTARVLATLPRLQHLSLVRTSILPVGIRSLAHGTVRCTLLSINLYNSRLIENTDPVIDELRASPRHRTAKVNFY
jgi:hypothetical protein